MHRGCRQRLAVTEMEKGGGEKIQKAEKPAEEQKSS